MGKPLVSAKQWTRNDVRMLIILQFILVYPILAGAMFMVLLLFALPRNSIWPHAYWLIASGAWVLLLAIILPLLRDHKDCKPTASQQNMKDYKPSGSQKEPEKKATESSSTDKIPQTHLRVDAEKIDDINRDSILTNRSSHKSKDRSSDGIEKGALEELAGKENIEKEVLNDCTSTTGDQNKEQDNADNLESVNQKQINAESLDDNNKTDMHNQNNAIADKQLDNTERENKNYDSDMEMIHAKHMNEMIEDDKSDKGRTDAEDGNIVNNKDNQNNESNTEEIESQIHTTDVVPSVTSNVIDKQQDNKSIADDEDIGKSDEVPSLTNGSCTEQTVSTPISTSTLQRQNSNVVHLFIQ